MSEKELLELLLLEHYWKLVKDGQADDIDVEMFREQLTRLRNRFLSKYFYYTYD